jgi:hypothetical protein
MVTVLGDDAHPGGPRLGSAPPSGTGAIALVEPQELEVPLVLVEAVVDHLVLGVAHHVVVLAALKVHFQTGIAVPAPRDPAAVLVNAAELGLLDARGERRGRHYVACEPLRKIREQLRAERKPLEDPYPTLIGEIRRALP